MKVKGFDKLVEKVPYLAGKKILFLPLYALFVIAVGAFILGYCYSLPGIILSLGFDAPLTVLAPLLGVLCIQSTGFILVFQVWRLKRKFRERYGINSFARVFPIGFTGVLFVLMLSFNQFIPFYDFSRLFWDHSPFRILITPIDSLSGSLAPILSISKYVIAALLFCTGILLVIRAFLTFGIDYMLLVYLYFPEESEVQNQKIYSALRHPAYAAIIIISLAGTIFSFTLFSVALFLLYLTGFLIHVRLVEEKELIERFGSSYEDYRKKVPAFFVKPKNLSILFGFLLGK